MSGPNSIILDPKLMFDTLQKLENETRLIAISMYSLGHTLQQVSTLTYAIGFGELIKKAEKEMNQVGEAVIAVNNSFNDTCKDIVNRLVEKFAPEGAKSTYNVPPFRGVHIKINVADRAAIYPAEMKTIFEEMEKKLKHLSILFVEIRDTYPNTKHFWVGHSADQTRHNFQAKVVPLFEDLWRVLLTIHSHGMAWIEETVKFEANLSTP